jgi:hypothetical protein
VGRGKVADVLAGLGEGGGSAPAGIEDKDVQAGDLRI